jgi:hypothetical protein
VYSCHISARIQSANKNHEMQAETVLCLSHSEHETEGGYAVLSVGLRNVYCSPNIITMIKSRRIRSILYVLGDMTNA